VKAAAAVDKEFGVAVKWDTPLLDGYRSKFLRNRTWKRTRGIYGGFFGLLHPGVIRELWRLPKCWVWVTGWNFATCWLLVIFARLFGHRVVLRGESPLHQELKKSKLNRFVKRIVLQRFLFKLCHRVFYMGHENREFFRYFGVPDRKLLFSPHSVDNASFQAAAAGFAGRKAELRRELGLPVDAYLVLTCGKYIPKKRPLDLLEAVAKLNDPTLAVGFVGEGELRPAMEAMIRERAIPNVTLTGFKNQGEIGKYYAAADLFVLPSGEGETWGLVVNEALNFDLPVIVSTEVGSGIDLAPETRFPVGDVEALAAMIRTVRAAGPQPGRSRERIDGYGYAQMIESVKVLLAE
jgi:glycosyltransferase involved in cell wall biosynthesis